MLNAKHIIQRLRWLPVAILALFWTFSAQGATLRQDSEGNYIIASVEDYMTLSSNSDFWGESIIQVVDIDLTGINLNPIGTHTKPFSGKYDGRGHKISNATVLWNQKNSDGYLYYGLFGYISGASNSQCAVVANLVVENMTLTRSEGAVASLTNSTNDVKIGILAGGITENVQIHDIALVGCTINDGGRATAVKAMMAGGVYGDQLRADASTSAAFANANFHVRNIFADVDIDLSNVTRSSGNESDPQFFVGGIGGRIRTAGNTMIVPYNTVYTGTLIAPIGSTSPTVDNMRYDKTDNKAEMLVMTYSGEIGAKNAVVGNRTDFDEFSRTRVFYDYKSYNSDDELMHDVTDALPANGPYMYRTRTFLPNANAAGTAALSVGFATDSKEWAKVQGYNWGKWIDPTAGAPEILSDMNDAVTEVVTGTTDKRYFWTWDGTNKRMVLNARFDLSQDVDVVIEPNADASVYTAKIVLKGTDTALPEIEADGTWQWQMSEDGINDWLDISGATANTTAVDGGYFYRVYWTSGSTVLYSDYMSPRTVVYVFDREYTQNYRENFPGETRFDYLFTGATETSCIYPDGNDANDGSTPDKAVCTLRRAYQLLAEEGNMFTNRIVIMGYYYEDNYLKKTLTADYNKAATVTGADNLYGLSGGIVGLISTSGNDFRVLGAPLRFDRISIHNPYNSRNNDGSYTDSRVGTDLFIMCNLFDFTVDVDVEMLGYRDMQTQMGLPSNITSVPHITICGATQDKNDLMPLTYPTGRGRYSQKGYGVITLRSGVYGRLILGGRNNGDNLVTHNVMGSPDNPVRTKLTVNINDINLDDNDPTNDKTRYGRRLLGEPGNYYYSPYCYSHNIALIAGGQTDGSVYAENETNIRNGYIGRVMAGSISYGRAMPDGYPSDSFFGRTITNIYGSTETFVEDGVEKIHYTTTVNEIYGGTLGRASSSTSPVEVDAYFYGESHLNLYGGRIGNYSGITDATKNIPQYAGQEQAERNALLTLSKERPSIYGAGGGGTTGVGDDLYHTTDKSIPYYDADGVLHYGDYDTATATGNRFPEIEVDLNKSHTKKIRIDQTVTSVNLYGGVIEGDVYGAGFGYSNNFKYMNVPGYNDATAYAQAGILYGDSYVTMELNADIRPAVVLGNIYGGGAGDARFIDAAPNGKKWKFERVATVYGNSYVSLKAGTVGDGKSADNGNVYGGSKGVAGYEDIAAVYGKSEVVVDGVTVYGNIFGGCSLANIRKYEGNDEAGNTYANILSGTIGNNIFGGSEGKLAEGSSKASKAIVEGDSHVTVEGGEFIDNPYIDIEDMGRIDADGQLYKTIGNKQVAINCVDNKEYYRTFNIYGGGYLNCDVKGTAHVNVSSSLLTHEASFVDPRQNPNALTISPDSAFKSAYMDVTFRRFCVYGGGYGENTNVLNTDVYVTIPRERTGVSLPHGRTLESFLVHQSFFDIAGGGYSGDIGHWETADGQLISDIDLTKAPYTVGDTKDANAVAPLYDHYVGGLCTVTIDDYTFARKVIGGGFYGSCRATNTHVRCGSLRQVYGGSLLGYVHDKALLQFGNRTEDFLGKKDGEWVLTTFKNPVEGAVPYDGDYDGARASAVWADAEAEARAYNDYIFITENIYGGNDVKGIIGTQKWTAPDGSYGLEDSDHSPLYQTDVDRTEEKGIVFNIFGGTFMGDVYGAGNGHYRGYYVPAWVRYEDGPARMYRHVKVGNETRNHGLVYRSRPMVGSVNIQIRGNSEADSVRIRGNFFGGGRECTIGQFNTFLPMEDPRRLEKGGHLHVNIGGYVNIGGNLYMGAEGKMYCEQNTIDASENIDLKTFDASTTRALERLGSLAYNHWYFKTDTLHNQGGYYVPGFPEPGELDGNFGMTGEHMYRSYMKNIEIEGDVELTFYSLLYERDADNNYVYWADDNGNPLIDATGTKLRKRRHWMPYELAATEYDAQCVNIHSFFLGGLCGSMTNNNVMIYNYQDGQEYDESQRETLIADGVPAEKLEAWGSVYRVVLPKGVTLREKVVMGSENATIKYYPYNASYTEVLDTREDGGQTVPADPYYVYEGGMVTQSPMTYDLIVYNDTRSEFKPSRTLPEDFYTNSAYQDIRTSTQHTVQHGPHQGTTIYRYTYNPTDHKFTVHRVGGSSIFDNRYGLTVTKDAQGKPLAYIGQRETRRESGVDTDDPLIANRQTMVKLSMVCNFDLLTAEGGSADDHTSHYGGLVYGGCYNSGLVVGDVVLNVASNLLDKHMDGMDTDHLLEYSQLKYNVGRVFGGGYGRESKVEGDTYVNLLLGFKGMNVFGGGMEGDVTGTTHVRYIGDETSSFIYGSIYGGGLRGAVGSPGHTELSTMVSLVSGNVRNVYGGACMGDLYGRTFVEVMDEYVSEFSHLDMSRLLTSKLMESWSGSRLVVGSVFGGNDIAGNIHEYTGPAIPVDPNNPLTEDFGKGYTTSVLVHEIQNTGHSAAPAQTPGGKDSPGSDNGFNGFPLVGNLYGGSNSDYGQLGDTQYVAGEVELATGVGIETITVPLAGDSNTGVAAYDIPHVNDAILHLHGGTIINGYGGGNMSTITDRLMIDVDYPLEAAKARAGFADEDEFDRVWRVLLLSSDEQQDEVTTLNDDGQKIFNHQIFRLFGGNDNADMAIQPTWSLKSAYIGSLYSGGNFGKMTYFNPAYDYSTHSLPTSADDPAYDWQAQGLTLTINSNDLTIDNVYGGGRVGDITPAVPDGYTLDKRYYGTTLNIVRGIIEHVYGGNDVAGYVTRGTNVNIYGAISGDVYCAGNGNYLYRYDRDANLFDYRDTRLRRVTESYQYATDEYRGARYFMMPALADYGFDITNLDDQGHGNYNATDAQTILAINSYRPNVERTMMYIAGFEDNPVWIKGNVYCGGNSSTVVPKAGDADYDVEFKIGSHVRINGVFMGSNGYELSQGPTMILNTEKLNASASGPLNLTGDNDLTDGDLAAGRMADTDAAVLNKRLYPTILDLYMRAVEIVEAPKDFNLPDDVTDAYIGEFVVGGNRGSMMTGKTISLEFPEQMTIYGRIIGGCKDANVTYNGVTHIGGLTQPLLAEAGGTKVDLRIKSHFRPLSLLYPDENVMPKISLNDYMVDINGNSIMIENPEFDKLDPTAHPEFIVNPAIASDQRFYHDQQCNVYGGCFTSGTTIGDVNIEMYSDMLRYDDVTDAVDKQAVINGINDVKSWRSFTVVGGGYGPDTEVRGDIRVAMLPHVCDKGVELPSVASIFAGSQEGLIVGNTTLEIRAGKVLANAYGASEAAIMYGSTHVIVGYPKYYRTKVAGVYKVERTDYMSKTARENIRDDKDRIIVSHTVAYREGDIVPANVYNAMVGRVNLSSIGDFELGLDVSDSQLALFGDANPKSDYFEEVGVADASTIRPYEPSDFSGVTWDDIEVWIGDQASNRNLKAPYYGHGNVYGGGYVPNSSNIALTGANTVLRYTDEYHPYDYNADVPDGYDPAEDLALVGYGGNTAVMIWDNAENADMTLDLDNGQTRDLSALRDHVHLGTGRYKVKDGIRAGSSRMGLYIYNTETEEYDYQTAGEISEADIAAGTVYYEKNADGGVYGGGRKVFAEGFRAIDLAYYGYAEHTPEKPKLLNTIQRADMASMTDCCMELIGASDFTIEEADNTLYAINRVGELRMISSLDPTRELVSGVADPDHSNIIRHDVRRSRNFIAFYHAVNHLAAFSSNWLFEDKYHLKDGVVTDETSTDVYKNDDVASYVSHKHDIIDLYEHYIAYKRDESDANRQALIDAYEAYVDSHADEVVTYTPTGIAEDDFVRLVDAVTEIFNKRNVATSANMIGINSGYALRFEGVNKHGVYYGPVYGVTEIKLLTVAIGEGGGYVYALNHHYDSVVDDAHTGVATDNWCQPYGHDFLMTTGNFVFPGAAYFMANEDRYNFIIDDCYPMSKGYYDYEAEHLAQRMRREAAGDFNVNDEQEIHYWYISGNTYTFNVNVTGITSDKPQNFWLNNEDDMVNLVSAKPGAQIRVKSVKWYEHNEGEACGEHGCDLRNLDKDYTLYFTVDHDSRNTYSYADGSFPASAFVSQITRGDYDADTNTATIDGVDPNAGNQTFDNYVDANGNTVANNARLGIRLADNVQNRFENDPPAVGRQYYAEHLSTPHQAQIILESTNPGENVTFTYVINLTIEYVLGPLIYGDIEIENCALPGEYIYANANNVYVDVDGENFGIVKQYWKLYPNDTEGYRIDAQHRRLTHDGYVVDDNGDCVTDHDGQRIESVPVYEDLSLWGMYSLGNTEKVVHVPAYWYQNGWELTYIVNVNGFELETRLPFDHQVDVDDPEHPGETVKEKRRSRLEVHNYHRMKPVYTGSLAGLDALQRKHLLLEDGVLDLKLVKGAKVYIENDEDEAYLFRYLNMFQDQEYSELSALGDKINPQYGEGIEFFQMANVTLPNSVPGAHQIIFRGNYHGKGNVLTIPETVSLNFVNQGRFYNLGFLSLVDRDDTKAFYDNQGSLINCYYFNVHGKGTFLGGHSKSQLGLLPGHTIYNCYQNTLTQQEISALGYEYNEMLHLSDAGFRYGQAAYNLNGYYLQKRHLLLHKAGADNNSLSLQLKDAEMRLSPDYADYAIEYVEDLFRNGDYRYAYWKEAENDGHFSMALRTAEVPNYLDRLGQRANNKNVSLHKYTHDVDETRWCDFHQCYHPNFEGDYLFFGEDLSKDLDENNSELPQPYTTTNRVYRVGGFYGSAADKGYYLNRVGYADAPQLTAVDFVGYRDRELYDNYGPNGQHGTLKSQYQTALEQTGWIVKSGRHEMFMAPTLDVPWRWDDESGAGLQHDFHGFDVNSDVVTHNLLVYTTDWADAMTEMAKFHYTDDAEAVRVQLGKDDHSFAEHSDATIRAHHIIDNPDDGGAPKVFGDYFHLVDNHDFNAPVAFRAQQAWLTRLPHDYADEYSDGDGYAYKTAWEGICLPYNVMKTYAASTNTDVQKDDMGEITHFSGDDWRGHEYWLRRLAAVNGDKLMFERPTALNDRPANAAGATDTVTDYHYTNDRIYEMYREFEYDDTGVADHHHDELYHSEDGPLDRVITGYRHLSASIPYIVAFPGERYYEFDLSGQFYYHKNPRVTQPVPQSITYFGKRDNVAGEFMVIPVTDMHPMAQYTYGDVTVKGTFKHVTNDTDMSQSVLYDLEPNLGVLDVTYPDQALTQHHGENFVKAGDKAVIMPFHVYATTTGSFGAPRRIASGDKASQPVVVVDPDDEPQTPEDEIADGVRMWLDGRTLVIETPDDRDFYIHNTLGQRVRHIRAFAGLNRYSGLPSGIYLIGSFKFKI